MNFLCPYKNNAGAFKYGLGGNITTVHNEVTDLGGIPEIISGVWAMPRTGRL